MRAAGVEVIGRHVALGVVTVTTAGAREATYHLSGPFEVALSTTKWRLVATPGTYSIFRATRVRPADWLEGATAGQSVTKIRNASWGDSWVSVNATSAVELVRSMAYLPGWRATAFNPATGHSVELTVTRHGLVQGVRVPAGGWVVHFHYHAPHIEIGVAASGAALVLWLAESAGSSSQGADGPPLAFARDRALHRRGIGPHGPGPGVGPRRPARLHRGGPGDPTEPAGHDGVHWAPRIDDVDPSSVDAVVDFSTPEGVVASARWCAANKKVLVIGTTGLSPAQRETVVAAGASTGVALCANFSIGAVLAERFAAQAAKYFDTVEVIELHHDRKVDAPSGTSLQAVRVMAAAREAAGLAPIVNPTTRETLAHTRGGEGAGGIRVHSVRLPGLTAHQEILFGGDGEGLTIRHDSYDRASFVHGVALALRHVTTSSGFVEGIDRFLG